MLFPLAILGVALLSDAEEQEGYYRRRSIRNRPFRYVGACPEMTRELINYITDETRERRSIPTRQIGYTAFARHVDLDEFRAIGHPAAWRISRPSNWGVSFYRAQLPSGQPLYFLDWSAMEHLFVCHPEEFDLQRETEIAAALEAMMP